MTLDASSELRRLVIVSKTKKNFSASMDVVSSVIRETTGGLFVPDSHIFHHRVFQPSREPLLL